MAMVFHDAAAAIIERVFNGVLRFRWNKSEQFIFFLTLKSSEIKKNKNWVHLEENHLFLLSLAQGAK